jgi:protein-disulfide isomerase
MSKTAPRGRAAQRASKAPMRSLYIVIALIALVALGGLVALAVTALRSPVAAPAAVPAGSVPQAPSVPIGQTPEGLYFKGNPDAPVVVTEYSDFQCPGCGYFATALEPRFDADYLATGKARFVYHDFPLNGHPHAILAAEAARAAGEQGKFWQMHDMLFANQRVWSSLADPTAQFVGYAGQLGLDQNAFSAALRDHTHRQAVVQARTDAERLLLSGTPSFAVNGKLVDTQGAQTVDEIEQRVRVAVEQALAGQ